MTAPATRPALQLLAAAWLAWLAAPALADDAPSTQAEAEERLDGLRRDIQALQEQLAQSRAAHQARQEELRALDLAIQETTRAVRTLDERRAQHELRLADLEQERTAELLRMSEREAELAAQLVATYRLARQSRLKLVLNQDDPVRVARLLAYYEHINRAQVDQIGVLRATLQRLETLLASIDREVAQIDTLRAQETETLNTRQAQRQDREALLKDLDRQIGSGEERLAELERDREDLERLIERLANALADIPSDLGGESSLTARKGQLPMPVGARVRHAFGQRRAADLRWQGWLLDAPSGAEVRSVAYGRVAFADWFRGYGLMMIIDHGQGFMSLYGYNESLLWDVGDWVESGATIATVGSGPSGEQGLYFELRRDGKAIDPAAWISR